MTAHLGLGGLALKRTAGLVHAKMVVGVVGSVLEYRGSGCRGGGRGESGGEEKGGRVSVLIGGGSHSMIVR